MGNKWQGYVMNCGVFFYNGCAFGRNPPSHKASAVAKDSDFVKTMTDKKARQVVATKKIDDAGKMMYEKKNECGQEYKTRNNVKCTSPLNLSWHHLVPTQNKEL